MVEPGYFLSSEENGPRQPVRYAHDAGYDRVYVGQIGADQAGFLQVLLAGDPPPALTDASPGRAHGFFALPPLKSSRQPSARISTSNRFAAR